MTMCSYRNLRGIIFKDSSLNLKRIVSAHSHLFSWLSHDESHCGPLGRSLLTFSTFSCCYKSHVDFQYGSKENVIRQKTLFPSPSASLNITQQIVEARLGLKNVFCHSFKVSSEGYVCNIVTKWPDHQIFSGTGCRKKIALADASLKALCWLVENGHVDKRARPVFSINNSILASLSEELATSVDNVLKTYFEEVVPTVNIVNLPFSEQEDEADKQPNHPILGTPMPRSSDLENWSQHLQQTHVLPPESDLPVESYRQLILDTVKNNRITIIKGGTGCGKSTKIPQFILDEEIRTGNGALCNIAVCQPRRITALAIAQRVANERGENIGSSIGHAVKFNVKFPNTLGGSIMFFTAGKFSQVFINNPTLEGVSHVILDEAHLRDTPTDVVMTLMKDALRQNKNLRLVVMSATLNIDIFTRFYDSIGNISDMEIPGRTFPVESYFLNDLPQSVVSKKGPVVSQAHLDPPFVAHVVKWIHETKPDGSILVFVSGWSDMLDITELLSSSESFFVTPVHSMLRDNSAAFSPPPHGQRKVILATNVAETSLTFPDVVYVVDCGVHKVHIRNPSQSGGWSTSKRLLSWISKANVLQRRGRAGRVQPGECFHLFSHENFNGMRDYEPPRIFSDNLEDVILQMKMVFPDEKAVDIMSRFPSPPNHMSIVKAVQFLQNANLLSLEDECPLPLAEVVSQLSASLPSAISLVYGTVFKCLDLVSSVVACTEGNFSYFSSVDGRSNLKVSKQKFHKSSDHIANGKALSHPDSDSKYSPVIKNVLYVKHKLLKQILSIVHGKETFIAGDLNINENDHELLVESVFLQSPCSLLVLKYEKDLTASLCGENGIAAAVRTGSVNYPVNKENCRSKLFMYLTGHTVKNVILVDEVTAVSPISVLLFLRRNFSEIEKGTCVELKAWNVPEVKIILPTEHWSRIKNLRKAVQIMVDYFVLTEVSGKSGPHDNLMNRFRRDLLDCIQSILTENHVKTNGSLNIGINKD